MYVYEQRSVIFSLYTCSIAQIASMYNATNNYYLRPVIIFDFNAKIISQIISL